MSADREPATAAQTPRPEHQAQQVGPPAGGGSELRAHNSPPAVPTTAAGHPHGSLVEQVHRVWTTDQGVDPWVLAEETVKFLRERIARDFERLAGNRDPDDPEGSAAYSRWAMSAADRIRHPERYEGCANAD